MHLLSSYILFLSSFCTSVVETLLDSGANAVCEDKDGFQPVHYAALSGQTRTLKLV